MDSGLFDFDYEVYGNGRLFYLNEVVEKVDGRDAGPILKDKHYEMMMAENRITVLNKAECGNGGTSGIVDYLKRHNTGGLILVPNVSISKGKEEKYKNDPDICCVYGGVDKIDWEAKIVIATYDQFKRLLTNLRDFGFAGDIFSNDFWRGRAIFVDEYHKLVDESKFRSIMAELTELIIKTDLSVTLMSATPHYGYIDALRRVLHNTKELISINVVYKDRCMTKRMSIYSPKMSELEGLVKMFINMNQQIYIFYNNVAKITKILNAIGTDDCEILCSESKKKDCGKYYSKSYNPEKKVHFLTSAYFTGHDIDGVVDKVIIIGGNSTVRGAIGMRDIKQILGRFREYCGESMSSIHLMYVKEKKNDAEYKSLMDMLKMTEDKLEAFGDNWIKNAACIEEKLNNLYCHDALERLGYWSSVEKLIKKLRNSGYVVDTKEENGKRVNKAKPIGELPDYTVEPNMAYRVAFTKIANGEEVSWKEYVRVNKIKDYIKKYGVTRNRSGKVVVPARDTVFNLVDIDEVVEGRKNKTAIDEMSKNDRYAAFGFDDGGIYKASYLMNCLRYIKENYPEVLSGELDYGLLPLYMKEVFGCLMFCWKVGNKDSAHQWCIIGGDAFSVTNNTTKNILFSDTNIYIEPLTEKRIDLVYKPIKVSYGTGTKADGHRYARTIELNNLSVKIPSLTGINLYDWVNKDKSNRLYQVKNCKSDSKRWDNIKNYEQLQISEFYRDTTNEYRHNKSEVNEVGCLIIDIDDSLLFDEFKKLYGGWKWLAYPTISNTNSNWNKFRVIIPLAHPVKIEGDNNLKVLKALRSSFCAYEDKCHGLGSYINQDDWRKRYINEGDVYSIEQSEVDLLQYLISVVCDYTKKKFDATEIEVSVNSNRRWWGLDKAIKLYEEAEASPMEGARHAALFKIKNNLSEEDCGRFEDWLWANHPNAVKKHWKSHKRIAS